MWNILNVKGPWEGRNLNNPDKYPVSEPNDERLDFLTRMGTSLKLVDTAKREQRIRGLTGDRANAWHVTLNCLVDLLTSLLGLVIDMRGIWCNKAANWGKLLDICGTNHKQSYFAKNEALSQA